MKTYDVEHAAIFPAYWRVNEMLANSFCEGTREDFKAILQRSMRRGEAQSLDVDLLLSCLQETLNFEHGLEQRFANEVCWAQRTTEGLQRLHYLVTRLHRHLGLQGRQAAWVQSSHLGGFRAVHESLGRVSGQVSSV
jgi:hypothetical protein